jgi:hypothetical protein
VENMYKIFSGAALLMGIFASIAFGELVTKDLPGPKRKWWQRFWVLFAMASLFAGALAADKNAEKRLEEQAVEMRQEFDHELADAIEQAHYDGWVAAYEDMESKQQQGGI